ncbi:NIPSNAP family protein [uncultured Mucilaginibacter sp.]|uniref:NIPSNAP family protein n=1 Tax=uncultured Mucilaginibacter sp. TaxID=797541 RepID=UPI0025F86AB2|nr:NIPSNAP family protein [uncultured Mucilaginibacter sp.]
MRTNKSTLIILSILVTLTFCFLNVTAETRFKKTRYFYEIKVYHLKTQEQINKTEQFLKTAYLPALHRIGISKVGVFKAIGNDTSLDKRIYVFIPSASTEVFAKMDEQLFNDAQLQSDGATYLNAAYNEAPYDRIETILLKAFIDRPEFATPLLTSPLAERVYELRSYESATDYLYRQKVKMFNAGKEVDIFTKLNFNPVFYGEVIAGGRMPNLMYLTTFNNKADRDEHWKQFGDGADWKQLSALPEYQNTISKADITFLRPVEYSDF